MGQVVLGRPRRAWFCGVAAAAFLILMLAPGTARAQGGGGGDCAGAPGIGDEYYPNYGNGGYDVGRYALRLSYNPASDRIKGTATIRARATQRLCSFNLDLVGLNVKEITVDGDRTGFARQGQELTVQPRDDLRRGDSFRTVVRYAGVPSEFTIPGTDIRTGFMATPEGANVVGQPEVAAGWFPVNDHPLDKASYAFDITVPNAYEVAANGFLRGRDREGGRTTWKWRAAEPMASYLATIDVGDWDVTRSTQAGFPAYDAVATEIEGGLRAEIEDSLSRQGEILQMLIDAFGPYPFSTLGAIVPNQDDLRFALENQTRPVYSKLFWQDRDGNPRDADWVVVHELAHQWYGDDVALARWQDIWLNEGFATYAEWLWEEYEGRATPQEIFQATYDDTPADDPLWAVVIGDPGVDLLFDNAVYVRGAMTLQALRNQVGEEDFWAIVREWASSKSGGNGTTPEFIALAEQISGQELDELFDTWLFTAGKPALPTAQAGAATARSAAQSAPSWTDVVRDRGVPERLEHAHD